MSTGRDNTEWVRLAGSATSAGWDVDITDGVAGWQHTGLLVATLAPGAAQSIELGSREAIVVPLSGGAVSVESARAGVVDRATLAGRESVWSGPSDTAYVPTGSTLVLTGASEGEVRVAVCLAADETGTEPPGFRHLTADQVPVELRGAGIASRQVRNFGVPGVLDANRMIACEVITPAGNWSSWPPHKHDTERPGMESELEEIYYFQARSIDERGTDAMGYQRVYAAGERPIDVLAEVRTDDVVLVPHGWHGPAVAAPDADLYYLNVMAGPGPERAWLICDDPAHAWVRESWPDLPVDPRLA
ncbi:MAG: 5-deoxy-glucuronate isomerase [Phycicoccus sp.]|uniref:5-deoxy-glucuronate isomerase n=1 Tax=Phycicoccus sp. TaxID=1902410 RepID=UPI002588DC4C|nr:5-deoxy-glucuronate isomerase [Phycicoccus sp.]MCO5303291.1 5-deoxy-glucuronate isomerase [Phycicoccus sp.]